jgi:hypothetical protein
MRVLFPRLFGLDYMSLVGTRFVSIPPNMIDIGR